MATILAKRPRRIAPVVGAARDGAFASPAGRKAWISTIFWLARLATGSAYREGRGKGHASARAGACTLRIAVWSQQTDCPVNPDRSLSARYAGRTPGWRLAGRATRPRRRRGSAHPLARPALRHCRSREHPEAERRTLSQQ